MRFNPWPSSSRKSILSTLMTFKSFVSSGNTQSGKKSPKSSKNWQRNSKLIPLILKMKSSGLAMNLKKKRWK